MYKSPEVIKIDEGKVSSSRKYSGEELLKCGIIVLNKPKGPRCRRIVEDIKVTLRLDRVGHAGTLDPITTGVLPILLGKATKLSDILSTSDKIYRGKCNIHEAISKKELLEGMKAFTGVITQVPPKLSAVARIARQRNVYWFKLLDFKERVASFEMACEHGTYVRKVCHDLGQKLGIGAHMFELERIKSGPYVLKGARNLKQVFAKFEKYKKTKDEKYIFDFIREPETAVEFIPKMWADDTALVSVLKGSPVFIPGVLRVTSDFEIGKTVAVFGQDNKLKALGKAMCSIESLKKEKHGVAVKTDLVLV